MALRVRARNRDPEGDAAVALHASLRLPRDGRMRPPLHMQLLCYHDSVTLKSGSSSAVERQLPKLDVAGSIPVSRSICSVLSFLGLNFAADGLRLLPLLMAKGFPRFVLHAQTASRRC